MNLIVLGPPGAGKGTQAKLIQERWGIVQLSTGDILREAAEAGDVIGVKAGPLLEAGDLVPDDIVNHVVAERIKNSDFRNGFILDGFPRTALQSQALDEMLAARGLKIDAVIRIIADDAVLLDRITGRYACSDCGAGYHDKHSRPKVEGVCDNCGSKSFVHRADDKAETVQLRLKNYRRATEPLLPYYRDQGVLFEVDGMKGIDNVAAQVDAILARFR